MQYNTPQSGHCVQNKTKPLCNHCVNCSSTVHYVLSAFPQLQVVGTKINDMEKLVCILCFYFKKSLKVKKTQAFLWRNFSEAIKCDFFMYCQANTIPIFFYLKKRRKRRKKRSVFSFYLLLLWRTNGLRLWSCRPSCELFHVPYWRGIMRQQRQKLQQASKKKQRREKTRGK